jgi:hypothetical protein
LAPFLLTKEMTLIGVSNQEYRDSIYNLLEVREKLPLEVIVGVSQELEHVLRWHLTLENFATMECCFFKPVRGNCRLMELRLRKNIICKYRLHMLFWCRTFPKKSFNLRLGYNEGRRITDSGTAQFLWCFTLVWVKIQ